MLCEDLSSYIILFPVVPHRLADADAVPPADIHGEMEAQPDRVEEMVVELDAQVAADAAQDIADAF